MACEDSQIGWTSTPDKCDSLPTAFDESNITSHCSKSPCTTCEDTSIASTCSRLDCKHSMCADATFPSIESTPESKDHTPSLDVTASTGESSCTADATFPSIEPTPESKDHTPSLDITASTEESGCTADTFCMTCPSESIYCPDSSVTKAQTPLPQRTRGGKGKICNVVHAWGVTPPYMEDGPEESTEVEAVSVENFEGGRITEVGGEGTEVDDVPKEVEEHDSSSQFSSQFSPFPSDNEFLPDHPETCMTLEPFRLFRKRVQCFMRRTAKAYTADYIEDHGVMSHRIVAIHHKKRQGASKRMPSQILRIPRKAKLWTDDAGVNLNIHHQVAVSGYARRLNLTAGPPAWLAYGATTANELGCSYILEAFCKGGVLRDKCWSFDIDTRLDICDQVINILSEQEKICFPQSGKLVSAWRLPDRHDDYVSGVQDPVELATSVKLEGLGIGVRIAPQNTFRGTIKALIKAWPLREKVWFLTSFDHMWKKLRVVADEMYRLHFFDEEDNHDAGAWYVLHTKPTNVLYHGDLHPRNLVVGPGGPNDRLVITGSLDWDDTIAVPVVVARRPPVWLWCRDIADLLPDWDGDADVLKTEPPLSEDDERVKALFFRKMEYQFPGYTRDCYNPRKRWSRRIWEIVRYGFFMGKHKARCERFFVDWEEWKKEYYPLGVPRDEHTGMLESFWTEEDDNPELLEALAQMQLF